jgi:acyl-CoA hydrolase
LLQNVIFGSSVVTAGIDRATFLKLVFISNALILKGILNYVKRSSNELEASMEAEDLDHRS